jgi:ABC-type transport system involved in cytochrome bd biosynthesis fused ATPase/permease subunit
MKKLTNLQMANSLFMMGHSMNKILTMARIIVWDQKETASESQHLGLVSQNEYLVFAMVIIYKRFHPY